MLIWSESQMLKWSFFGRFLSLTSLFWYSVYSDGVWACVCVCVHLIEWTAIVEQWPMHGICTKQQCTAWIHVWFGLNVSWNQNKQRFIPFGTLVSPSLFYANCSCSFCASVLRMSERCVCVSKCMFDDGILMQSKRARYRIPTALDMTVQVSR